MGFLSWGVLANVFYLDAVRHVVELQAAAAQGASVGAQLLEAHERLVVQQRLLLIPLLFDPLTLLYFASIYPRRNALNRARTLAPFAVAGVVFLAIDVFAPVPVPSQMMLGQRVGPFAHLGLRLALLGYILGAYLFALRALVGEMLDAPGKVTRERARLLSIGLGVAIFSRIGLSLEEMPFVFHLYDAVGMAQGLLLVRLSQLALALGAAWLFHLAFARGAGLQERALLRGVRRATVAVIILLAAVVWLPYSLNVLFDGATGGLATVVLGALERMRFSVRWLVFGAIVGYSILRYQLFDLSTRARSALVSTGLAAGLVGAFGAVMFLFVDDEAMAQSSPATKSTLLVGAALALFIVHDALRRYIVRFAREPDAAAVRARKMEVYRAAVEAATDPEAASLVELRRELGLTPEEVAAVEALVRSPRATGPLRPGLSVAGRYDVERLLGRGGGGRVFVARDAMLDRLVVLKEVVQSDDGVERALAEAKLAGELMHPNVVVVFDIVPWRGGHLIVMEYVAGGSLDARLRERGPLPLREARAHLVGLLGALAAVHERGIVHGDVKPANVLLTPTDDVKLADFGIARARRAATQTALGGGARGMTLRYAAPEVAAGGRATPQSDVHSAALVLVEALTGVDGPGPLAERELPAGMPPRLEAALRRALARDAAARFPDARVFLEALGPDARVQQRR